MRKMRAFLLRLGGLFHKRRRDRELAEEIESHLQLHIEDNVRAGMNPEEARRQALLKLGGIEPTKEAYRDQRGLPFPEGLAQDLSYALRILRKKPGFTVAAVLTLVLGIGANTAIFSVVDAVLLRPLPYRDPEGLVSIWETKLEENRLAGPVAPADFIDWRDQSQVFEQIAAIDPFASFNLTGDQEPERVQAARVSANLFSLLGVSAQIGRSFLPNEEQVGQEQVVILSHAFWQRRFGADPNLVGKTLPLNDTNFTVVGILPSDFRFISRQADFQFLSKQFDLWVPLALDLDKLQRGTHPLRVLARLKQGVTLGQAQAEMDVIARRLEMQYPESKKGEGVNLIPLGERVTGDVKPALLVLLGAVGLILMIASANVANLLLTRATARSKELAVRSALGATRLRIVCQLLIESLLLATIGGLLALLVGQWAVGPWVALCPHDLPMMGEIGLNGRVLTLSLLLSTLTAMIFGLMPSLTASRINFTDSLKEGSRTAGGAHARRLRGVLVVSELAIAFIVLVACGLLLKSLWYLERVNLGFSPENRLTMQLSLPQSRYPEGPQISRFYQDLLRRVKEVPGVVSVGAVNYLPLSGTYNSWAFGIEGRAPLPPGKYIMADWRVVSPGYFRTMGIPLRSGRDFTETDTPDRSPVVIINEAMAARFWPSEDPLGKRLKVGGQFAGWREIIGVVGDVRHFGPARQPDPEMYVPYLASNQPWREMTLVVRTSSDPARMAAAVRREVRSIDEDQPVYNIRAMEQLLSGSLSRQRFLALLLEVFAVLALVLAAIGVYSVMSYSVTQQTREIGIRIALGGSRADVLGLVIGRGMVLALIGVGAGIVAALALTRLISSLLYGIRPNDPATFAAVVFGLVGATVLASYIPARRATKVDPMVAIRDE